MSQLEPPATVEEPADSEDPQSHTIAIPGGTGTVTLPPDASPNECAALAAAIGAHLGDRERAAAAAAASDEPDHVDQWRFASRLRSRGKRRWPRTVERGEEWKAAARSFPR